MKPLQDQMRLFLCALALASCQPEQKAENNFEGYNVSDCRQPSAQSAAARYTSIMLRAFEQEPRAAAYNTLENVQRLVCMANGESTFGTDTGRAFHGAFQMASGTQKSFCPGMSMKDPLQNARCALRIAFTGANGHRPQGWGAWPNTSKHCQAGTGIRRCFDGVVETNYQKNDCGAGANLSADETGDQGLSVSASFTHKECTATQFYVQLVNTQTKPFQESQMHGPFPLAASTAGKPGASGSGVIPLSLSANYIVARFILRDGANKEVWRSGQEAPSPKIRRNSAQEP